MNQGVYHIPALLPQTVDALDAANAHVLVDATYGGGGHTRGMLEAMGPDGCVYAFDQDMDAIERAIAQGLPPRLHLIRGNFRFMANFLRYYGVVPGTVDGVLADLGVSFHHFDDPDRGFSFRFDGPLDMRMNRSAALTARSLLESATEERLADIFYLYGELKQARRLAAAIVAARRQGEIATAQDLIKACGSLISPKQEKKELAQLFQALRIEVNGELDALKQMLKQATDMLRPGGRLAIITYHSLEDRLVKNFMKTGNFEGRADSDIFGRTSAPLRLLGSKPIVADDAEVAANPRSRSAKLRVAAKQEPNQPLS